MHWVIICVNSLILCWYTRLTPHFSTDKSGLLLRNKNATQVHWLHWCESNPHGMNDTEMNECPYNKINLLSSVMLLGSNGLTTPNMVFKKILKLWARNIWLQLQTNVAWMIMKWKNNTVQIPSNWDYYTNSQVVGSSLKAYIFDGRTTVEFDVQENSD